MAQASHFLQVGLAAIEVAETIFLDYLSRGPVATRFKADQSPVTQADLDIEAAVIKTIKAAFPDHSFLGEESGTSAQQSEYTWVIDPIDGTKFFARNLPFCGTLLTLAQHNQPILGIVNIPALKSRIYAQKGQGTFIGKRRVHVSSVSDLKTAYTVHGSIKNVEKVGLTSQLVNLSQHTEFCRSFANPLNQTWLAEGKIDGIVEPKGGYWDFATAKIIVEEAGGRVTDLRGQPLTVDSTSMIASNGLIHDQLVEYFQTN